MSFRASCETLFIVSCNLDCIIMLLSQSPKIEGKFRFLQSEDSVTQATLAVLLDLLLSAQGVELCTIITPCPFPYPRKATRLRHVPCTTLLRCKILKGICELGCLIRFNQAKGLTKRNKICAYDTMLIDR